MDARQLDYTCNQRFFQTLVKHPSDGSKNGDVGHAWVYLQGGCEVLEIGHTGEQGIYCPKYFQGIMDEVDQGNPNPICYLWEPLDDGYWQMGSGNHIPTFAIKVNITPEQFNHIKVYIQSYDFLKYALRSRNCCSFVQQVAALVDLNLSTEIVMSIEPTVRVGGETICLWQDPCYSQIEFPAPEKLEQSMIQAVEEGKAECALDWYLRHFPQRRSIHWRTFPNACHRVWFFTS